MDQRNIGKIGIIGNGSWGTALAKILTDNHHPITWWVRNPRSVRSLQERHHNAVYLTSVYFPKELIDPSDNLEYVLKQCDTLVVAVPSAYVQEAIEQVPKSLWGNKKIISAVKGIIPNTNQLLNDYLTDYLGKEVTYAAITGPCHAEEVAEARLSYLTFSGLDQHFTETVASLFRNDYIHTTWNHDLWGAQYAAVLKNIYAIGAGMAHALDYGDNFMSVYATNCYREMHQFLSRHFEQVHPSPQMPDFHTSAYLGDLLVTCYSLHSRNRRLGNMIGKGYSMQAAILEMNMIAEGYYAAKCMQHIAGSYQIPIPIAHMIYQILWEEKSPTEIFPQLEHMLH